MGCFKVMEGEIQKDAQRREGCGIFSTHLLWRGFLKISCPHRLPQWSSPTSPKSASVWISGFEGL